MGLENQTDKDLTYENGAWTQAIKPSGDAGKIFAQTTFERMKEFPDRLCQIDGLTGEEDTYASILDRAVRCAIWLRKQNVKSGDFIGICSHYHLDTVIPLIAAIFNGITFHPWWDMALDEDMIKYFLKLGEPKVMFVNKETAEPIRKAIDDLSMETQVIVFEDSLGGVSFLDILKEQDNEEVANFECMRIEDLKQAAIMLNTSGTTGYPKGVLHSYDWLANCSSLNLGLNVADCRFLWSSGICWISAIASTMQLLNHRATVVVHPSMDARIACQLIEKYQIHVFITTVQLANQLHKDKDDMHYDLSSTAFVFYGGAYVSEDVHQYLIQTFPNAEVSFIYGCTEVGVTTFTERATDKVGSCGKVRGNCQIKIINIENRKTLGVNEEGEVCMQSPYLFLGYHKDSKSTEEAMDADGWYHTGDIAYYDADGDFFIVDRIKEIIKYRVVEIVIPSTIERLILKHSDITEVVVVPKRDLIDWEQPMAFITKRAGAKLTEEDIIKLVEDNLPDRMRLRGGVKILEKMPVTPSGKIARRILRQMAKNIIHGNYSFPL